MAIARKNLLRGQFRGTDGPEKRDKAWEEIVASVNAVSEVKRDRQACETRLRCFPSVVKKNVVAQQADAKKTGGGPPTTAVYDEELVDLALTWLDITSVEGVGGGGETALESEDETQVEKNRQEDKEADLERRCLMQERLRKSMAKELNDPTLANPKKNVPSKEKSTIVIPDTDEDSVINTPRKVTVRRARKAANPTSSSIPTCDVTCLVDSIEKLTDAANKINLSINLASRDFLGKQRDVSYVDTQSGSDVPFEARFNEVETQTPTWASTKEDIPMYFTEERALASLKEVLKVELPQVSQSTWKVLIGRAMKSNLKELFAEEQRFNRLLDLIGDQGQDELMRLFDQESPELLKCSPPEVSFKVLILLFDYFVENDIIVDPPERYMKKVHPSTSTAGSDMGESPSTSTQHLYLEESVGMAPLPETPDKSKEKLGKSPKVSEVTPKFKSPKRPSSPTPPPKVTRGKKPKDDGTKGKVEEKKTTKRRTRRK